METSLLLGQMNLLNKIYYNQMRSKNGSQNLIFLDSSISYLNGFRPIIKTRKPSQFQKNRPSFSSIVEQKDEKRKFSAHLYQHKNQSNEKKNKFNSLESVKIKKIIPQQFKYPHKHKLSYYLELSEKEQEFEFLRQKIKIRKSLQKKIKTEKDQSVQKQKKEIKLNQQQFKLYGNRFPEGFYKHKILGKGGFSIVWEGIHKKTKKIYAIKQINTKNTHQTYIKQIWFCNFFFENGGKIKSCFKNQRGISNLLKFYSYQVNDIDAWLFFQYGGQSLGTILYEIQPLQLNKSYKLVPKYFYNKIRRSISVLKQLIVQIAKVLQLLAQNGIVHSDVKTENILVSLDQFKNIKKVKLIDYGSSFQFKNLKDFAMATPQYMPPEILNFILFENNLSYNKKMLEITKFRYTKPWVVDVWSLGCIVLQIITGVPLWMSIQTKLCFTKFENVRKKGLFAVKNRVFDKIIKKQLQVSKNLQQYLSLQNNSRLKIDQDLNFALRKMLNIDPQNRISPTQLIDLFTKQ